MTHRETAVSGVVWALLVVWLAFPSGSSAVFLDCVCKAHWILHSWEPRDNQSGYWESFSQVYCYRLWKDSLWKFGDIPVYFMRSKTLICLFPPYTEFICCMRYGSSIVYHNTRITTFRCFSVAFKIYCSYKSIDPVKNSIALQSLMTSLYRADIQSFLYSLHSWF